VLLLSAHDDVGNGLSVCVLLLWIRVLCALAPLPVFIHRLGFAK
jgi:hypothetical protein